jgi:hypothetical protein
MYSKSLRYFDLLTLRLADALRYRFIDLTAPIVGLLPRGRPSDVAGAVAVVIVYPVDGMLP